MKKLLLISALLMVCLAGRAQTTIRPILSTLADTAPTRHQAPRIENDTIPALFLCADTCFTYEAYRDTTSKFFSYDFQDSSIVTGMRLKKVPKPCFALITGYWIRRRRVEKVTPLPYWETLPSIPAITRLESVYEDALPSSPDPANCLDEKKKPLGMIVMAVKILSK